MASTMISLSVAVVAQVDAHPLVLVSHRRLAIMADETNIAKNLKSEDLLYKEVMTKYNLPQGTQIYEIAGCFYTKETARSDGALYWQDLQCHTSARTVSGC